ncbi:oxidoreductase [Luteimonas sp. RD2P54]|uniref:Oxidoreductase n=1 Tax=Luteimonas endophytica TaxID=3042023 RepID=A0ABT6J683_9GAMM|nr:oxidoreductase [Luteimonas endophytica]MDH5822067.1 oxidoreductase [Luteimonas endophytica]
MKPVLNAALVGYGFAGRVFHAPLIAHTPGLALHTVVSGRAAAVRADHPQARVVAQPQAAFADPAIDLVVIATPNPSHAPLALEALRAGRHVVVDKPFAVSLAEAGAVVAAAERAGRMVSVFHNRRWDTDFLTLRGLLDAGALGEIVELQSHFDRFRPEVPDRWRERPGPGAGLWFDLGPHLVDQALQLFGMPETVQADLAAMRDGAGVDDWFQATLRWPRRRALLHASTLCAAGSLRLAAHGTGGSFVKHGLDPQEARLRAGVVPGSPGWDERPEPGELVRTAGEGLRREPVASVPGDYRAYYAGIRAAILGQAAPPVTAVQALEVMRVLEAGLESARTGAAVRPGPG